MSPQSDRILGPGRHPAVGLAFLLLLQSFFIHVWPGFHAANESSRFYFVESVVLEGSLSIDPALARYGVPNIDASLREGRHYMDKAPGLALAAVPVYGALQALGIAETLNWNALWPLLTFLCVTLPSLFGTALLYRLARDISGRRDGALVVAALYALATPALLYSTLFFGHQPAAVLLLAGFAALQPERQAPVSAGRAALAGFLLSFAVVTEYQAVLAAAGLALFGLARAGTARRRLWLVGAGLVPAVGLLAYHWAAFGHPLAFPYAFKAHAAFAAVHEQGLFGFDWPSWERSRELLVGPRRGLLYGAPFLILYPLGLWRLFGVPSWRLARWAVTWTGLAHVLLISGYLYWTGGDSVGPRFLVPALPFLVLPLAALWRPVQGDKAEILMRSLREGVLPGLALVALLHQAVPHATFPYYPETMSHPFFDLSVPLLLRGCAAPSPVGLEGHLSLLLFLAGLALALLWLWRGTRRPGVPPMVRAFLAALAALSFLLVLGAQVTMAPDPGRPSAVRQRADIKSLIDCGDILLLRPDPPDTRAGRSRDRAE